MSFKPNIVLVGFMGSGKTSTGKELAKYLNFKFLDIDYLIETENKKGIFEIFEKYGEKYFRDQEKKEIEKIKLDERCIISTGGGIWLNPDNRFSLLELGWCIWLKVSVEQAWKRISPHLAQRPLIARSKDPINDIIKLIQERNPIYALSNFSVDTDEKSSKEVASEIIAALKEVRPFDLSLL
jgi:shikimate kinase